MIDEIIETELNHGVDIFQFEGSFGVGEKGSKGVEKRLKNYPYEFSKCCAKKFGFDFGRDVGINYIMALKLKGKKRKINQIASHL